MSKTLGVDGEYVNIKTLAIPEERFIPYDLKRPYCIDRAFDLVVSLEVAEHLTADCAEPSWIRQQGSDPYERSPLFVPALMRVLLLIVAPSRSPHLRLPTCTTLRTPKASGSPERSAADGGYGARANPRPAPSLPPSRRMPPS